jgi:hypothetical protein
MRIEEVYINRLVIANTVEQRSALQMCPEILIW